MESYVFAGVLVIAAVIVRGVELYFRDKREARDKEIKFSTELLAQVVELKDANVALDKHIHARLEVYEKALTSSLVAYKQIVADTEAERRKTVVGQAANQMRPNPFKGKLPTP